MSRYTVIYADPPWPYSNQQSHDPHRGGYTYSPMPIEDICRLPIQRIADSDSALFLWATMPKLPEALKVMGAWGYRHTTTAFVWVKKNPSGMGWYSGMGSWTCGNAEFVLFGKRGHPKRVRKDIKQIVISPRGRHSAKPDEVRRRIELLMGDVPRIELFARRRTPGWDSWGNEVHSDVELNV